MHVIEAHSGHRTLENARAGVGCCANMENLKSCGASVRSTRQRCQEGWYKPSGHWWWKDFGMRPSLFAPNVCPHKHTLGAFPLFPKQILLPKTYICINRCCIWLLAAPFCIQLQSSLFRFRFSRHYDLNVWNFEGREISKKALVQFFQCWTLILCAFQNGSGSKNEELVALSKN